MTATLKDAQTKRLKQLVASRSIEELKMAELKRIADQSLDDKALHNNLKCRYRQIETINTNFEAVHAQIVNLFFSVDEAELVPHNQKYIQFQNDFFHVQAIYMQIFEDVKDVTLNLNQSTSSAGHTNIKLPKISLPKFNGDLTQWRTFIDMYDSMIHDVDGMSNIDKFNYLLTSLQGAPLALVKRTPLTGQNYTVAYNSLRKRYHNDRLIGTSHWRAIEQTRKLTTSDNSQAFRLLIDTFNENLSMLENLGHDIKRWDFILFNMLLDRLDSSTATNFELECGSKLKNDEYFTVLQEFVQKHCDALDTVNFNSSQTRKSFIRPKATDALLNNASNNTVRQRMSSSLVSNAQKLECQLCHGDHMIYNCQNFLSKSPNDRYSLIKTYKWCSNCLGSRHSASQCSSQVSCKRCSGKHHTLLHFDRSFTHPSHAPPAPGVIAGSHHTSNNTQPPDRSIPSSSTSVNMFTQSHSTVLLSTAQIEVQAKDGNFRKARVILDSASQSNFISSKLANQLGLCKSNLKISIAGIGQLSSQANQGVTCMVKPVDADQPSLVLDFILLPTISPPLPGETLSHKSFPQFSHLKLADPQFKESRPIDMLLGADVFGFLLTGNSISTSLHEPVALETIFGWVIMGRVNYSSQNASQHHSFFTSTELTLEDSIKRFWELDQVPEVFPLSPEDIFVENHFLKTFSRSKSGRFQICLPFRDGEPHFRGSRDIALRRFFSLERKLLHNPELYNLYKEFMHEYLISEHMTPVCPDQFSSSGYYIPHFCILRPDSTTTKLRVVFDASARDLNSISLNDTLFTGQKLQQDIISIILRFRVHAVVFTADIKQMFRQIIVSPAHRHFQRIIWRFSKEEPIQEFQLNTVTYGVCSSPFHAIRVLLQLSYEYENEFPLAASILRSDTYVDDVVTGADNLSDALEYQRQLIGLLLKGEFELRKFASNEPTLLSHLPPSSLLYDPLSFERDTMLKILGLQWNPSADVFSYSVLPIDKSCTKRNVLSQVARIFDPSGFLTPLVLYLKIILQKLWTEGLNWDDPVPFKLSNSWNHFRKELPSISNLSIPRLIYPRYTVSCSLHGFSDASKAGYAGVIYLRCVDQYQNISTHLVCAKSRVAPLKTISIPRLELCGALLLSNLLYYTLEILKTKIHIDDIHSWTDSTITLTWINASPHKWTTFVCNRVTEIQNKIPSSTWRHVRSKYNPADPASRGLSPSELLQCRLWWAGPKWLSLPHEQWPPDIGIPIHDLPETDEERRKVVLTSTTVVNHPFSSLLFRYSSLLKIQRIIAYILRFCYNSKHTVNRHVDIFSPEEMEHALLLLIKFTQSDAFPQEIQKIKTKKLLPKPLQRLTPFLDTAGVIRVGGRLIHSELSFEAKHPILLPSSHRFTQLLIEHTHQKYLHPGHQTLQNLLVQRYWILAPKRAIRSVISKCIPCFRLNPSSPQPLMGNLPSARVSQVKSFAHVGIDMAGPLSITLKRVRGAKTYKAYMCVFICMATRATHIELCSDLSTEVFLAAFRRFIARRGRCSDVYSDCGTNFRGASNYISSLMKSVSSEEQIKFHFNSPMSPNFGGLWESQIKCIKSHLYRVIGNQILSYEELNTLLIQIESILNSRPMCPISNDPNDFQALTPGHFLTLEPLNSLPDPNLGNLKISRLSRWQLIQRLHQSFWERWHKEYLHHLMQRSKWIQPSTPIEPNTLVLLKNELSPPLTWHLGRVERIHPGPDGITRVVTVRTNKGLLRRPVSKVCPLPIGAP